jgi:putative hydrolase of HD superfamily
VALVRFMQIASKLKTVRRQGWIDRGVAEPESVADHSWSVALLAWTLAGERDDLDRNRVLLLGLIHDLPEALAGDTTPFDAQRDEMGQISAEHFSRPPTYSTAAKDLKRQAEEQALDEMLAGLPDSLRVEIRDAWQEYEEAETPEARFVKQVDKLETVIQAESYFALQPELQIESFRQGARRDINDPQLRRILEELLGG